MVAMIAETARTPLTTRVADQLVSSGRTRLRDVEVHEEAGAVVLRGRVPSFYLKQVAQTLARSVHGVTTIRNEMIVTTATP